MLNDSFRIFTHTMETTNFYATACGFIVLTVVFYSLLFSELKKGLALTLWEEGRKKKIFNRSLLAVVLWTVFISALGLSGFLQDFSTFPPRLMIVLVVPLVTILFITFSGTTKELLRHIDMKNIIRLQVFRVFVELLLWSLLLQNLMPVQMSFEGRNFDVISGATAPLAAYFLANNKTALVIWNLFSLGLLINIVTIAILSLPSPLRVFMNEPANTIVTYFPFVWLPGLLVPLAYGLHFLSLRKLTIK